MVDRNKQGMRILMTADTVGGVWTYALDLIEALQPHGIQVHLATMGKLPSHSQQKQAAAIPNLHLHSRNYKLEWMDDPWQEVEEAGEWLLSLEKELEPNLIHLNNYCHGQLSWKAPVVMVGHSCVLSWWKAVKGKEAPGNYQKYAQKVKEGLQAADLVVAPTHSYLKTLKEHYGPLYHCRVIPNSRKPGLFKPQPKEPIVFSMGRLWDEAKNITSLAEAAQQIPWPVKVAGDARHPGSGKTADFPNLELLGLLNEEEAAQQLTKTGIYVMPAKYEPFGLSVLEAALSGCAMVLGDIPSLRENWNNMALFAKPDSPEEISEKILFLIQNPAIRKEMGRKAQAKAAEFLPEKQATFYLDQYQELVKGKKRNKYMRQREKFENLKI